MIGMAFLRRFAKLYLENQIQLGLQHSAVATTLKGVAPLKPVDVSPRPELVSCNHTERCGSVEAQSSESVAHQQRVATTLKGVAPLKLNNELDHAWRLAVMLQPH